MRKLLRDLTPGQTYAMQVRSIGNDGTISDWSQVFRFLTQGDQIAPAPVTNLSLAVQGSSFIAKWTKPTTDAQGNLMFDFKDYEVTVSSGGTSRVYYTTTDHFEFTLQMNIDVFTTAATTVDFTVKARDLTYNKSTGVTQTVTVATPPVPSTPVIGTYLGQLTVTWDGNPASGTRNNFNLNQVEVHASTTNNFTPDATTLKGRFAGSFPGPQQTTLSGFAYGTPVYVKLIAVNHVGLKSAPSAQASGTPARITGLDIQNNQIGTAQINFTAKQIGGANAYFPATNTARDALTGVKDGDIAYVTGDRYNTYRYNGTTWVAAPEIGQIAGTKILTGTLTADAVGTNLLITSSANIGNLVVDDANIANLNVAKLKTGSIQASQSIIAGPLDQNHAEVTDTGFYVKGPQPGTVAGQAPLIVDRIRMGTGVSDFFAIPDPMAPEGTLAQIDENGSASFQGLSVQNDPEFMSRPLSDLLRESGSKIVGRAKMYPTTMEPAGNVGIRGEYGVGQFSFPVEAGRTYEITAVLFYMYATTTVDICAKLRWQKDLRTQAQIDADEPPTPVMNTSVDAVHFRKYPAVPAGVHITGDWNMFYHADFTGIISFGLSLMTERPLDANTVIKVRNDAWLELVAKDLGPTVVETERIHNQGGTLYSASSTPTTPTNPTPKVQYKKEARFNWVHSYLGNGTLKSGDSYAYQGQSPYGPNGNMIGYFGFSNVNWGTLLSGATVDRVDLYIYFAHWYNNSGGTARIGYHNVFGDPGGANRSGTMVNFLDVGGWPKPGGKTITVTSQLGAALKSGAARGISLGPGSSTSFTYYGYASDCRLTVWYTK